MKPDLPLMPTHFPDVDALEDFMTLPSPALVNAMASIDGDLLVLGAGGKMGPTLARLAKRAAPHKRVIAVARFSDPAVRERLQSWGIECVACDLLSLADLHALPPVRNVVFMAGHKFGGTDNPALTWAMNAGVPFAVADHFRASRIVAFSTACVYPFVPVDGPGAPESMPTEPPPGLYANTCVAREQMFLHGSARHGTPGRLVRLSYAIDMRYGVLHDVASRVHKGEAVDVSMGYVNVIWQGDANEQALRMLLHCTTPTSALNVSGAHKVGVAWLADQFGQRLGKPAKVVGTAASDAWLVDTTQAQQLFGPPRVPLETLMDWTARWLIDGQPGLGKETHFGARDGKY